jgi:hypothetical protein
MNDAKKNNISLSPAYRKAAVEKIRRISYREIELA